MFKWLDKFKFPDKTSIRPLTSYDEEETVRIINRAHVAEKRFDVEFNDLMNQLDIAKRKRDERDG